MKLISAKEFFMGCDPVLFTNWAETPWDDRSQFVYEIIEEAAEGGVILDRADVIATLDKGGE